MSNYKFNKIKDEILREVVIRYALSFGEKNGKNNINMAIDELKGMNYTDLTWNWAIRRENGAQIVRSIKLLYILHDMGKYNYDGLDYCKETMLQLTYHNFQNLEKDWFKDVNPYSFFRVETLTNKCTKNCMIVIPDIEREFHDLFKEYTKHGSKYITGHGSVKTLGYVFKGTRRKSILDFNDETFEKDIKNSYKMRDLKRKKGITSYYQTSAPLIAFYIYIQDCLLEQGIGKSNFEIYTKHDVLCYAHLAGCLESGFKVVNYSPYTDCPKEDKLLLKLHDDNPIAANISTVIAVDFSPAKNPAMRKYIKECFWCDKSKDYTSNRVKYYHLFKLDEIIFSRIGLSEEFEFKMEDILKYKNYVLSRGYSCSHESNYLSKCKQLLEYVYSNGYQKSNNTLIHLLAHKYTTENSYTDYYTKDEISYLIDCYKQEYEKCTDRIAKKRYILEYYLVILLSTTEIRRASLLQLKTDCLIKTMSSKGKDEYKVRCPSKTSKNEMDEYNVSHYVKEIIEECINITQEDREKANPFVSQYIFISERVSHSEIKNLSDRSIDDHLEKMAEKYNFKYKPMSAIRNYYQNAVTKYAEDNEYPDKIVEALSKHRIDVHEKHYVTRDIKEVCKLLYKVEIGDIDLKGQIIEENETRYKKENIVMNGCGQCENDVCNLDGNLDCLMCKHFISTPSRIPYFQSEIEKLDKKIENETLKHEKEFYTTKKTLFVAYLEKLMAIKEEGNSNEL